MESVDAMSTLDPRPPHAFGCNGLPSDQPTGEMGRRLHCYGCPVHRGRSSQRIRPSHLDRHAVVQPSCIAWLCLALLASIELRSDWRGAYSSVKSDKKFSMAYLANAQAPLERKLKVKHSPGGHRVPRCRYPLAWPASPHVEAFAGCLGSRSPNARASTLG